MDASGSGAEHRNLVTDMKFVPQTTRNRDNQAMGLTQPVFPKVAD